MSLAIYTHNLSRAVTGGDVGDFISASSIAGIPHAPGYPLFTFLGFLLTRIHFLTPAFMVGVISAFFSSLSVALFYFLSLKFTKSRLTALVSSLILAFNYLFWFYSEIAEVFALNAFFVVVLFFLSYLYNKKANTKILYVLAFFAGLSLTNHQTIILVFPSVFILLFPNLFKDIKNLRKVLFSLLFFAAGFSFYIYIPIASFYNPPLNWDNVKDLNSFLHLILRKDYGTFNAGPINAPNLAQRVVILKTYSFDLLTQLTLPVILMSVLGVFYLIKKEIKLFISFSLAFLLSGPLFIAYAGFPLESSFLVGVYERFFVMSSVIFLFFFPFGLLYFSELIGKIFKKTTFNSLFIGLFLIIPMSLFYYNFPKTDLHNIYIGDRLAYDLLSPLPKNSVLFLSGDTPLFNVWYAKYSLNFRPDVEVVNINGLGSDVYIASERNKYLKDHPGEKSNPDLFINVVKNIDKSRPVFSIVELQPKKGDKNSWVPYGLSFKLEESSGGVPSKEDFLKNTYSVWSGFKKPTILEKESLALGSLSIADIPSTYTNALLKIGSFMYSQYNDKDLAYVFFKKALSENPEYYKTYQVFGLYYLDIEKNCSLAEENLNKAKSIYPLDTVSYYLLYLTYRDCFKSKSKTDKLLKEYKDTFKNDFFSDVKKSKELQTTLK